MKLKLFFHLNVFLINLCLHGFGTTDGFIPKTWYKLGFATGTAHDKQTNYALRYVTAEWFNSNRMPNSQWIIIDESRSKPPEAEDMFKSYYGKNGKKYVKRFNSAVDDIEEANADTDGKMPIKNDPAFHFDAEKFADANENVFKLKGMITKQIHEENYKEARVNLGRALHILQDFYSHSNWVELENKDILHNMGDKNYFFTTTSKKTCTDCEHHFPYVYYTCNNNIISNDKSMTSGYYSGQKDSNSNKVIKPAGKCSHGGPLDETRTQSATGGINKDSDSRLWSPHYYKHDDAVKLSIKASRHFINYIRGTVSDTKFGRLLCLVPVESLIYVMDTTSKMDPFLEAAKERTNVLIDSAIEDEKPTNYVIVPFNDPQYGPLFKTENPNQFKEWVSSLTAIGGGDLPEMCFSGIQIAAEAAYPSSSVFVFTDAPAKDFNLYNNVLITALTQNIKLYFILDDSSYKNSANEYQNYITISEQTGGQVYLTSNSTHDIYATSSVINTLMESYTVTILKENDFFIPAGSSRNISFNIDSFSTSCTIVLHGRPNLNYIDLMLHSPNSAANITLSSASLIKVALISSPINGSWILQLSSTGNSATLNIEIHSTSDNNVECKYYYSDQDSNHPGLQAMTGNPIVGFNYTVQCTSFNSNSFILTTLSLINSSNGNPIASFSLEKDNDTENEYKALVLIPLFPYYARIEGKEVVSDLKIVRIIPTVMMPSFILLSVEQINDSLHIQQGQYLQVELTINYLGFSSWLQLSAHSSTTFVQVYLSQTHVYLDQHSKFNLTITCFANTNATEGSTATIRLVAETQSGDKNYLQLLLYILYKIPDVIPPMCKILSDTYLTSCPGIGVSKCTSSMWSAAIEFSDEHSEIIYLVSKVYLLNNTLQYYPNLKVDADKIWNTNWNGSTSLPAQYYKATMTVACCVENSDFIPIDRAGLGATCTVGKPLATNLPDFSSTDNADLTASYTTGKFFQTSSSITISNSVACQSYLIATIVSLALRKF